MCNNGQASGWPQAPVVQTLPNCMQGNRAQQNIKRRSCWMLMLCQEMLRFHLPWHMVPRPCLQPLQESWQQPQQQQEGGQGGLASAGSGPGGRFPRPGMPVPPRGPPFQPYAARPFQGAFPGSPSFVAGVPHCGLLQPEPEGYHHWLQHCTVAIRIQHVAAACVCMKVQWACSIIGRNRSQRHSRLKTSLF